MVSRVRFKNNYNVIISRQTNLKGIIIKAADYLDMDEILNVMCKIAHEFLQGMYHLFVNCYVKWDSINIISLL